MCMMMRAAVDESGHFSPLQPFAMSVRKDCFAKLAFTQTNRLDFRYKVGVKKKEL